MNIRSSIGKLNLQQFQNTITKFDFEVSAHMHVLLNRVYTTTSSIKGLSSYISSTDFSHPTMSVKTIQGCSCRKYLISSFWVYAILGTKITVQRDGGWMDIMLSLKYLVV